LALRELFGDCSNSPQPADITADVSPMPIILEEGENITLFLEVDLKEPLPEGAIVEIDLKKEGWIDLPIPCIDAGDGNMVGSCDYDVGEILAGMDAVGCPTEEFPEGQGCALPLSPGVYGGEPALVITVPAIDPTIGGLLSNGKFYGQIKFKVDGATWACIWARLQID